MKKNVKNFLSLDNLQRKFKGKNNENFRTARYFSIFYFSCLKKHQNCFHFNELNNSIIQSFLTYEKKKIFPYKYELEAKKKKKKKTQTKVTQHIFFLSIKILL